MTAASSLRIEVLTGAHDVSAFDCGKPPLNIYLQRHALTNQGANAGRTRVMVEGNNKVIGYYTLTPASVAHQDAPARVAKGLARNPIGVILLARLAVDNAWRGGKGIGPALLKDALLKTLQAAEIISARALLVHAKDDEAKSFYEHFNFEPSPSDPFHLFLLTKDIAANAPKP